MVAAAQPPRYTPEEYLALEREAEYRSEYVNGYIYAMSGGTPEHAFITANVTGSLWSRLTGGPCRPGSTDLRIKGNPRGGLYTYPDVVIVCGRPELDSLDANTVTNPTLIVEVLSPSTEAFDRGDKFAHYRTLPSFREYVLVAQDKPRVERFTRQADGQWLFAAATDLNSSVYLASVGCDLPLADVYAGIAFDAVPDAVDASRNGSAPESGTAD